ncbi:MAG: TIGR00269 family protein [Nitrososphaerota archaeon]|nr:TIGR00269 family protein [Nitrososphaerota archaeon]MDG6923043.1 TIGR00269 family protein [Nitrososphaerota archaeon]
MERSKPKPQCRCGGKTVFFRAYNGESLCAACFNDSIFDKVKRTISRYDMLRYGDKVGVALSGGKDSSSLLYIMSKIMKGHGSELYALTIDEGIAGYREESVRNAETLAKELGVSLLLGSYKEFFGVSLDEALKERTERRIKTTSCAFCGPLRRRSIDLAAGKLGVNVVATAHNLDDILQTFFINLYSGDPERIRWLDPSYKPVQNEFKLRRIKPAMDIYEEELAFFAYLNKLPFQSESCPYMNEGIRTGIRLHLNDLERKHPGIKYGTLKTVLAMASTMQFDAADLKKTTRCEKCGSVSTSPVCSVCQSLQLIS